MTNVAILYTTFMRDGLLESTLNSYLTRLRKDDYLLIADQGHQNEDKTAMYNLIQNEHVKIFTLPFDCGLSYARNRLVEEANNLKVKFCLVTADSIKLIQPLEDLKVLGEFLETRKEYGIIGLNDQSKTDWNMNIRLVPGSGFVLRVSDEEMKYNDISVIRCDLCPNFFLAKTELLVHNKWDEQFKLGEHEDFFWRLKTETYYKVFYTEHYKARHIDLREGEYKVYRDRLYNTYKQLFMKKYGLKSWLKYER